MKRTESLMSFWALLILSYIAVVAENRTDFVVFFILSILSLTFYISNKKIE